MKNTRELTEKERDFLVRQGLNPKEFLGSRKTAEFYVFCKISTDKPVAIRR